MRMRNDDALRYAKERSRIFTIEAKERIRWWIEMLRSGKYRQIRGQLKGKNDAYPTKHSGHCCLGVACELYQTVVGGAWEIRTYDTKPAFVPDFKGRDMVDERRHLMPRVVMEWLGLTTEEQEVLFNLNDDGASFRQIADVLEAWIS